MRYQPTTKQNIRKFSKIIKYISEMGDGPNDDDIIMPEPLAKKNRISVQPPKSRRVQRPNILRKVTVAKPNKSKTQPEATTSANKETHATIQPLLREVQCDTVQQTKVATVEREPEVIPAIKLASAAEDNLFSCPANTCCYMTIRRQSMMEHLLHHSLRYHCSLCSNRYSFLAPARAHWARDHSASLFTAQSLVRCDAAYNKLVETVFRKHK